jgi:5-methyltetrahydropteroyltriglutamate--homocysteine methyltransferase
MYLASKDKPLATTITGSLPRPGWFVESLRGRSFTHAIGLDADYREQYMDALAALLSDQSAAGLDIFTDGDMRFDRDVAGRDWYGYLFDRLDGLGDIAIRALPIPGAPPGKIPRTETPGDILHEVQETRMPPVVTGTIGRGRLEYDAVWKTAQKLSRQPVKIGSCSAQMVDKLSLPGHYADRRDAVMAFSAALNAEYHALADAGAPVIQVEEPCFHFLGDGEWDVSLDFYVEAFNREVEGLRDKTEVWCHTCWGNPFAQKLEAGYAYSTVLDFLARLDVDVVTFETADDDGAELAEIAAAIGTDKKICIGVVSHRTLHVETADQVAGLITKALKHIEPERLILSSDCGFGRQGMSRAHAFYKMVAIVQGANLVRRDLGLPEAPVPVADSRFSLL